VFLIGQRAMSSEMSMKILICDDSDFSRRSIKKGVPTDLGVVIEEAADGEQALAKCNDSAIGLVLLDLNMPKLDGFGVLEALKKVANPPPVIVITANIQAEPAERAKALGARAVLQKPLNAAKLEGVIRHVLEGRAA
jgi:CheY-like chemotaxis protein